MQGQQDITKYINAVGTILRIHNFPDYEDYINEMKTRVNTNSALMKYDAAWGALWAITRYPEHVIEDDMIVDCLSVSDLFFDEEQQQYFLNMFRI